MIFHNTKLINLGETEVSLFLFVLLVVFFPRREMQTTSRYASRTSASLGEGYSFIALRFGTCRWTDRNSYTSVQRVQDNCVWLQATGQVGGAELIRH